ncbi:MAG: prolyl oligopeptidase family serine peptidase [Planctomycetes bacterium]|nr:prolyl oligopeptidase family serine peptidase [Planctomycetota bacterium]
MTTVFAIFIVSLAEPGFAQGTRADYQRAESLPGLYRDKLRTFRPALRWLPSGRGLWWRERTGTDGGYVLANAETGELERAADPKALGLDAETGPRTLDEGSRRAAKSPREARDDRERRVPRLVLRNHNAVLVTSEGEVRLSSDGTDKDAYSGRPYRSPDGKKVLCFQETRVETRTIPLVESSPKVGVQPKLSTVAYRKPGDPIPQRRPRLFDLEKRVQIRVDDAPFVDSYSVSQVHWSADSRFVHCLYNRRGHQQLALLAIDAETGEVRMIVDERSETFVDYSQKTWLHWLGGDRELLWMSERDGYNHLYRIDARSGEVLAQLTKGCWVVRSVHHVDEARREVTFVAMGLHEGQDPYHQHLARVGFDGGGLIALTASDGNHGDFEFSEDRTLFTTRWSRVDHPFVTELRRVRDGSLVCELGRDDDAGLRDAGFVAPERFVAKGRDGTTDIHGILIRPSNFDAQKHYPVIEAIYAGPHGHHVPKSFGLGIRQRRLAELGFIVVQIDGMGTNWRSKAFHDVCWQNLADAGLPDRIAWLRAAAKQHPELDLTRVGIYGGSAGGQNALAALLHHGDFYVAAAADCGCHDNRMDKIWWNEAWMGTLGPHYAENSNVTHAAKLQGKLLLTVGELDKNVDPASTLQVVDALIRAGKDFEFCLVPGAGHGIGEGPYLFRRRQDFFVRALHGVEPRR